MLPQVLFDTRFLTCPELDDGVRGQYKLKGLQRGKIRTRVKVTNPMAAHGNRTSRFISRDAQLHSSARRLSPALRHGQWIGRPSSTAGHVVVLYAHNTGRPTSCSVFDA